MRRRLIQVAAVLSLGCAAGCATIIHGTKQDVTITSDPAGARVTVLSKVNGYLAERSHPGVTPLQVKLTRRDPGMVIRFEKDGCAPVEIGVKRSLSGWTFSNLLFANPFAGQGADSPQAASSIYIELLLTAGALIGIDHSTGGAYNLPTWLHATLCSPGRNPQCARGCSAR